MRIEAIKEKARGHEQREEWQKALELYLKAIDKLDEADEPDVALFNRVGDLEVRLGRVEDAVHHYERAADLYMESELPNNAIAVCKKVARSLPDRPSIFLKMGQIRATQGFLTDARQNFLRYAEAKQSQGDIEAALDALVQFVNLAPEDNEIRLALARQLAQHDREEEAVEHYREAYRRLILDGKDEEAFGAAEALRELDPQAELDDPETIRAAGPEALPVTGGEEADDWSSPFTDFSGDEGESAAGDGSGAAADEEFEISHGSDLGGGQFAGGGDAAAEGAGAETVEEEEEVEPLPLMSFEDDDEEDAEPVPTMEAGDEEPVADEPAAQEAREEALEEAASDARAGAAEVDGAEEASGTELEEWVAEVGEAAGAAGAGPAADSHQALAEAGRVDEAMEALREEIERHPDDVERRQRLVEYAFRTEDQDVLVSAYRGLARTLRREGSTQRARAIYKQVLDLDPENEDAQRALVELPGEEEVAPSREVASSEEYVDLGAMIFDEEEEEKTTRFVVPAEAPSGDEDADFAKMLTQFKEKVARNVSADDVVAHYDLGTAYKEMGLIDEAIGEFQAALRARRDHLPTYEMLGQCFLEQGQAEVAVRTLSKALETPHEIEDELLGIYYYLGRAYEAMGREETAKEYYEKVFGLDINFRDVTERLRALR